LAGPIKPETPPKNRDWTDELVTASDTLERYRAQPTTSAQVRENLDLLGQLGDLARATLTPASEERPVSAGSSSTPAQAAPSFSHERKAEPTKLLASLAPQTKPAPPSGTYSTQNTEYQPALKQNDRLAQALIEFHERTQPAAYRPRLDPTQDFQAALIAAATARKHKQSTQVSPPSAATVRNPEEFAPAETPIVDAQPKPQPAARSWRGRGAPILRPGS
jgi:hypothetical protein